MQNKMQKKEAQEYVNDLLDGKQTIEPGIETGVLESLRETLQLIVTVETEQQTLQKRLRVLYDTLQQLVGQKEAYLNLLVQAENIRRNADSAPISLEELRKAVGADKVELIPNEKKE